MKKLIACVVGVVVFGVPLSGKANIVQYFDRETFLAENNIVSTEDFEEFEQMYLFENPATIDGVVYDCDNSTELWRAYTGLESDSDGRFLVPHNDGRVHTLTFGENHWTNAIGFDLKSQFYSSEAEYYFSLTVTTTTGETALLDVNPQWDFFGFASPHGIRSVEVDKYADNPFWGRAQFDNVSRGEVVPEPSTLALLSMGVVALLLCFRRRVPLAHLDGAFDRGGKGR